MFMVNNQSELFKSYFPGTNSAYGFYSLYHHIINENANRIFLLKGGPGVGKSTFMKKIGEELAGRGSRLEYHYCSSDPDSLDAIVIPHLQVALIDGTTPHDRDPKYPGVLDEFVNLGVCWNSDELLNFKEEIMSLTLKVKRCFALAYSYLAEAYTAYHEINRIYYSINNKTEFIDLYNNISDKIFPSIQFKKPASEHPRSLFAHSITPKGIISLLHTLIDDSYNIYAIKSNEFSLGSKELISKITQTAWDIGYKVEKLHCPFDPVHIDGLIMPELKSVIINTSPPFHDNIHCLNNNNFYEEYNLTYTLDYPEIDYVNETCVRIQQLLKRTYDYLGKAKNNHEQLEYFYLKAMDFTRVEKLRQEILQKIEKYG